MCSRCLAPARARPAGGMVGDAPAPAPSECARSSRRPVLGTARRAPRTQARSRANGAACGLPRRDRHDRECGQRAVTSAPAISICAGVHRLDPRAAPLLDRASDPNTPAFQLLQLQARVRKRALVAFQRRDGEVFRPAPPEVDVDRAAAFADRQHVPLDHGETAPNAPGYPCRIRGVLRTRNMRFPRGQAPADRAALFRAQKSGSAARCRRRLPPPARGPCASSSSWIGLPSDGLRPRRRTGRSGRRPGPSSTAGCPARPRAFPAPPAPPRLARLELRCRASRTSATVRQRQRASVGDRTHRRRTDRLPGCIRPCLEPSRPPRNRREHAGESHADPQRPTPPAAQNNPEPWQRRGKSAAGCR